MGFADALRSLLRQDPDVIMVGEIRDSETALIAIQASLTGHLVLATLHTNDSVSAVTRLINMGIEPYLIGAALRGIISQRLVRRLCVRCRKPGRIPQALRRRVEKLAPGKRFYESHGCDTCRTSGFTGRILRNRRQPPRRRRSNSRSVNTGWPFRMCSTPDSDRGWLHPR